MKFRIWSEIECGGEKIFAGYEAPCDARTCGERTGIGTYERGHGHVILDTDDGHAWLPFPFESREGLATFLGMLKQRGDADFTDEVIAHVLSQKGLAGFPEKMTVAERTWLATPWIMERLLQYGYVGFGR